MFKRSITCILLLTLLLVTQTIPANAWEIDQTSQVTSIVDGDSFHITGDEVRLADVNAPEYNQPGGTQATNALTSLISGRTIYLDTDDKSGRDQYGRLVAVVYIKYNSTHYLNVNEELLIQGVVALTDYSNNEFNPYTWTRYVRYNFSSTTSGSTPVIIIGLVFLMAILLILGLLFKLGYLKKGLFMPKHARTPRYYGSPLGLIIKAIAIDDEHDLSEIREQTGMPNDEFLKLIYHLLNTNELVGSEKGTFDLVEEIKDEWRRYLKIDN
jgi:endonuclease YncB( thermonuclease family)